MQLKNFKQYISFIILVTLFTATIAMRVIIYVKNGLNSENVVINGEETLEIKLPIVDWGRYEALSKHYSNGKVKKESNL